VYTPSPKGKKMGVSSSISGWSGGSLEVRFSAFCQFLKINFCSHLS